MTDTIHTVGIFSPGDMGAGIGGVLRQTGLEVLGLLEGRSELTRTRATEAGFRDAGTLDDLVRESDLILSVLVPSEARGIGSDVAAAIQRTGATPTYVDCNAVAPATVRAIESEIRAAGGSFIDAGIIGGPPKAPGSPTRFFCSGPDTAAFETLRDHGLNVYVVGSEIGQASGLKMVYAAGTKGTTALWTELLVAARAMGLFDVLVNEFGNDSTASRQMNHIPTMLRRARRWVGEMEEIAATFEALGLTPNILQGAADMYTFVGDTRLGALTSRDADPPLDEILALLSGELGIKA